VVPCGVPGLWLPGCLRATSPRLLTSPYLTLLAELLAAGRLELRDDFLELMDLAKRGHQAPGGGNGAPELDLDLHADDIDENVFLGESRPAVLAVLAEQNARGRTETPRFDVYFGVQRLIAAKAFYRSNRCRNCDAIENEQTRPPYFYPELCPIATHALVRAISHPGVGVVHAAIRCLLFRKRAFRRNDRPIVHINGRYALALVTTS